MQNRSSRFLIHREPGLACAKKANAARRTILLLSVGLILNASLAVAAEPILSLTMAKLDIRSERRAPISRFAPGTSTTIQNARHVEAFLPRPTEFLSFSHSLVLKKSTAEERHHLLQLTRRSARNQDAKLWASASIQAGYGEIYPDETSALAGHNGTRWEEPSCGYIKIRFRF